MVQPTFITKQKVWIPPEDHYLLCWSAEDLCNRGRTVGSLPLKKKNVSKEVEPCSLCNAKTVIDFRVPLVWTTRDLHKQLQGNWQISTWGLKSHWLIWISDYWERETRFAQGWPVENSALQLSVKSFLGELKRRKGKCTLSGCLVRSDLIRSFMFSCL